MRIIARKRHALNTAHSERVFEFTIKAFLFKKNKSDQTLEMKTPLTKLSRPFFPPSKKTSSESEFWILTVK